MTSIYEQITLSTGAFGERGRNSLPRSIARNVISGGDVGQESPAWWALRTLAQAQAVTGGRLSAMMALVGSLGHLCLSRLVANGMLQQSWRYSLLSSLLRLTRVVGLARLVVRITTGAFAFVYESHTRNANRVAREDLMMGIVTDSITPWDTRLSDKVIDSVDVDAPDFEEVEGEPVAARAARYQQWELASNSGPTPWVVRKYVQVLQLKYGVPKRTESNELSIRRYLNLQFEQDSVRHKDRVRYSPEIIARTFVASARQLEPQLAVEVSAPAQRRGIIFDALRPRKD